MKPTAWFAALAAMTVSCNALAVGDVARVTIIDCSTGAVLTPHLHHGEYRVAGSPGTTYAARTGRPANVGVVGVAVFRERQQPQVFLPPPSPAPLADRWVSSRRPLAPVANPFPASPHGNTFRILRQGSAATPYSLKSVELSGVGITLAART
jgi:hypothetical protein